MYWTSALAIYFIFWFFCLFLVLPFYARKSEDDGLPLVPGQAESAPAHFPVWRVVLRVSLVAALLCGLYLANYHYGWITADQITIFRPPAR